MKITKVLVVTLMMSVFMCACGEKQNDNNSYSVADNASQYQSGEIGETTVTSSETGFHPDYDEGEQNLSMLSSYVVSQGKWVYYYSSDEIMKMDENKNIYTVFSVSDVKSICVIGDWIYYYKYNEIGRVKTDGTNQEIIKNVKIRTPFLIKDNMLLYVEERDSSATSEEYFLQGYDTNSKEYFLSDESFNGKILGLYKDKVYLIEENSLYCVDIGQGEENEVLTMEGLEGGFIYGDELLYSRSSGWADTQTDLYVVNLENGTLDYSTQFEFGKDSSQLLSTGQVAELCGACNVSGKECWVMRVDFSTIYLVPAEEAKETLPDDLAVTKVVEEDKNEVSIYRACVVDNYIYYLGDSNATTHLYRIAFDGTDWMQLY